MFQPGNQILSFASDLEPGNFKVFPPFFSPGSKAGLPIQFVRFWIELLIPFAKFWELPKGDTFGVLSWG